MFGIGKTIFCLPECFRIVNRIHAGISLFSWDTEIGNTGLGSI